MTTKDLKRTIGERLGGYPNYQISLDMSKTHSQDNSRIEEHNRFVLEKFSGLVDINEVFKRFDCWKGICFFSPNRKFDSAIATFGGWTTIEIIQWILTKGKEIIEEDIEEFYYHKEEISRVITYEQRYNVLKRQKWRCNQCGCKLKYNYDSNWAGEVGHIDNIHPFSKRSTYPKGEENINESSNLQALCPKCNLSKNNKTIH